MSNHKITPTIPSSTTELPEYNARVVDNISLAARTKLPAEYIDPLTGNKLYNQAAIDQACTEARLDIKRVGAMRQWLNEDRITDPDKMVTNGELLFWLTGEVKHLEKLKEKGVK
jgi:hypothetical protein